MLNIIIAAGHFPSKARRSDEDLRRGIFTHVGGRAPVVTRHDRTGGVHGCVWFNEFQGLYGNFKG